MVKSDVPELQKIAAVEWLRVSDSPILQIVMRSKLKSENRNCKSDEASAAP